jgi:wobble nucleotide-excising tRNase
MSKPKKYFDALHVMSEGHIRCLGLAILLAKNIEQKCPVLLFDDPVNAIDEDHREGIRRTLFEDDHLSDTQIILTCHGEEFYKDIQNLLGKLEVKKSNLYSFLPHDGDNRIKVDSEPTPRNFIVSAEEHFAKGNIRYALADSRRALESVSNRTWAFLKNKDKGTLSIRMRAPKSKPELQNLVQQLRRQLNDSSFSHTKKDGLAHGLDLLINIQDSQKVWGYLNTGTHDGEDLPEFERSIVRSIIDALVHIDATLSNKTQ